MKKVLLFACVVGIFYSCKDNAPQISGAVKESSSPEGARVGQSGVLFSSFTYSSDPASKATIYRNSDGNSVGSVIYQDPNSSQYFSKPIVTVGDFDGDGEDELISAFNSPSGPRFYRNEDGNSIAGPGGAGVFYGNTGWVIDGVVGADMNGDGKSELYISMYKPEEATSRIYKSDGYSYTSYYYQPSDRRHTALTAGDMDGNGKSELYVAQYKQTLGGVELYKIIENTYNPIATLIYSTPTTTMTISALACGDLDFNSKDELFTAVNAPTGIAIYRDSTGISPISNPIYTSGTYFSLAALAAGDVDGDGRDELMSGFNSPSGPRIYRSEDGTSIGGPSGGISYPLPSSLILSSISISKYYNAYP